MITARIENSSTVIDFSSLETYDDFDIIIEKLRGIFKVTILEVINGPESRICRMTIDSKEFMLANNPYGNYLRPNNKKSEDYLLQSVTKLRQAFT